VPIVVATTFIITIGNKSDKANLGDITRAARTTRSVPVMHKVAVVAGSRFVEMG
jgi:hypothetical protein